MRKTLLGLLAFAALATPALAQQSTPMLDDLDADRLNDGQIKIEFDYQGSACETVLPATLGDTTGTTLAVTFPTENSAEVCTMQVVENEVEQSIEAAANVTDVEVTLLKPDGSVAAAGMAKVDND